MEGDEVKRRRKMKTIKELPREPVPIIEVGEESDGEERGGFEAHSEQPVLSPTIGQETPAPSKTENRGKQRAKNEDCSNS